MMVRFILILVLVVWSQYLGGQGSPLQEVQEGMDPTVMEIMERMGKNIVP
jgi:hypothetical protein